MIAQLKRASPSGVKSVSESIRGLLAQEFCLQKFVKTFWQVRKITTMYGTDDGNQKSGINSPVEGKVVYPHYLLKVLGPSKRWLGMGFLVAINRITTWSTLAPISCF